MAGPLALLGGLSAASDILGGLAGALGARPKTDKLRETATEFETVFLEQVLDRLTEGEGADGPLGENGTGGGVYRSMLAKEHAAAIVKSGGVGLAGSVYRQLLQMQEGAAGAR